MNRIFLVLSALILGSMALSAEEVLEKSILGLDDPRWGQQHYGNYIDFASQSGNWSKFIEAGKKSKDLNALFKKEFSEFNKAAQKKFKDATGYSLNFHSNVDEFHKALIYAKALRDYERGYDKSSNLISDSQMVYYVGASQMEYLRSLFGNEAVSTLKTEKGVSLSESYLPFTKDVSLNIPDESVFSRSKMPDGSYEYTYTDATNKDNTVSYKSKHEYAGHKFSSNGDYFIRLWQTVDQAKKEESVYILSELDESHHEYLQGSVAFDKVKGRVRVMYFESDPRKIKEVADQLNDHQKSLKRGASLEWLNNLTKKTCEI